MKRILLKFDCHLDATEEEWPAYTLVKRFAKKWKPDLVVDGGDYFNFNYISTYDQRRARLLEGKRFKADYDLGNRDLDFWQSVSKEYIALEGNHDERVQRLIDEQPRFEGLIEVDRNLHLKERGIKFYRLREKPLMLGKLLVIHGHKATKYTARRNLEKYKHNVVCGHIHRFEVASDGLPLLDESIMSWTIGSLCPLQPEWRAGDPTDWSNGFAVMYLDEGTGRFSFYPVYISKYWEFWFEGKRYGL